MKTRDELIALMIPVFRDFNGDRDKSLAAVLDALAPELLGPPSDDEVAMMHRPKTDIRHNLHDLIANRFFAAISQKKTPEERVTIEEDGTVYRVFVDGVQEVEFFTMPTTRAYRRGRIEELKDKEKQQ